MYGQWLEIGVKKNPDIGNLLLPCFVNILYFSNKSTFGRVVSFYLYAYLSRYMRSSHGFTHTHSFALSEKQQHKNVCISL